MKNEINQMEQSYKLTNNNNPSFNTTKNNISNIKIDQE